jgi:hypothetical protein
MEILIVLAIWRITSLLSQESGPFDIFEKINKTIPGMDCFWCLSLWAAAPFAYFLHPEAFLLYWLGYSAAAIVVNAVIDKLET